MWTGPGKSTLKKAKTVPSACKVMATIFWDSHRIIIIFYLQKGKTVTGEYYSSLLDRFDPTVKEKRPHLAKKSAFPPQNTPSHTSAISMAKLFYLRYEILPHPPCFPDLSSSDYFLFPNMKTWLGRNRFSLNEDIIAAKNEYFEGFDKNYFLEGIKELEYLYNNFLDLIKHFDGTSPGENSKQEKKKINSHSALVITDASFLIKIKFTFNA